MEIKTPLSIDPVTKKMSSYRRVYQKLGQLISEYDVWVILLVMIAAGAVMTPLFLDPVNIENLLRQSTIIGVMTIGQFLVLVSGGFDLSVASILALSSIITAKYTGDGSYAGLFYALAAGSIIGFLNGVIITRWKLHPFIITIGMMALARGLAYIVADAAIMLEDQTLLNLDKVSFGFIPLPTVVWLVLAAIVYVIIRFFPIGIYIYAVGGKETTARLAGIPVNWIKVTVYTISGFLAAIAGILFVTRSSTGMPHIAGGWELDTIAAAVIGGTNMFGGEGSLPKAMAGVIIYMMIRNLMNLVGLDPFVQDVMKGAVILLAVAWRVRQAGGK
jgi:ribose transport system permease protein